MNEYIIPTNVGMNDSIGSFKIRNLIEMAIVCIVMFRVLMSIPFVSDIKTIIVVIVELGLAIFFGHGIKDESVTSFFTNYIRFKMKSGKLRLRVAGLTKINMDEAEYSNNFEKYTHKLKEKLRKKNGEES